MNEKIKNLAVIILPANISQTEIKQVFDSVLDKLAKESATALNSREGFMAILDSADLFKACSVDMPNPKLITLAENLLHEFGDKLNNPVVFTTSFICEYYGPRDLINHEVVTMLANVKEGSTDWNYLQYKNLSFLVYNCRDILSSQR